MSKDITREEDASTWQGHQGNHETDMLIFFMQKQEIKGQIISGTPK